MRTDAAPWALQVQRTLIVAFTYGLVGKACLLLGGPGISGALLWLPLGVVTAVWLRWGAASLPGVLLGALALLADPVTFRPMVLALVAGDLLGAAVAVAGMRRSGFNRRLEQHGDVGLLVLLSLLGALVGAAASLSVLAIATGQPPTAQGLLVAALGRWIGFLLAGLPLMALHREALRRAFAPASRRRTLLLLGTMLVSTLLAFSLPPERSTGRWHWPARCHAARGAAGARRHRAASTAASLLALAVASLGGQAWDPLHSRHRSFPRHRAGSTLRSSWAAC